MKQAIKRKTRVKPTIEDIQAKLGIEVNDNIDESIVFTNADKPIEFISMPEGFQEALKIPGFPQGYVSIITGWSNTGKSSIKNALIASCINNGILPVLYETEQNFDWKFAIDCGVKATPVYGMVDVEFVDEETGEVKVEKEEQIIRYKGDFLYFDTVTLCQKYGDNDYSTGKKTKNKRKVAVIEDIAYSINEILDLQDEGVIQQPVCFIWDSVGSLPSFKSYASKTGNNMFDAGALSAAFNVPLNNRIPSSRKVSSEFTNTFVCVNKIWNDSMNAVGGAASIELKGGKSLYYAARLIVHCGGVAKAGIKKLTATAKGQNYNYGIISKLRVTKNQLPTPYNLTYEGECAFVHNGLCSVNALDDYKKTHAKAILEQLQDISDNKDSKVTISDLVFGEVDDIND